ncbi:efflux RND transporter periplasmic adaptor subunit [Tropicimonas sp.]|uniref:efflux RND transporter periplasmic adaptor subunit n=1 Tax=Tropicimonas sp. TaxID=2067044 RepID=UPI003A89C2B0
MRVFSILLALLAAGAVYLLVMQRDAVMRFAGAARGAETGAETAAETGAAAEQSQSVAEETGPKRVSIVAMKSAADVIDNAVLVRGTTEALREVTVMAETAGTIVSEPLRKGTMVDAGQVLCGIDPGTRLAQLSEAQARLAEARASLPLAEARMTEANALLTEAEINENAASKLIEGGYASETRVAAARAAVSSARASIESARSGLESATAGVEAATASVAVAEKEIDRLTIAAPFAGVLETDTAELGSLMQAGAACATVIQLDPMKLVGFVPETRVEKVTVGARAGARLVSGTEVHGTVTFLSRSADPLTRTFRVEIAVPNADLAIRDGQTADIAIEAPGESAHLLPQSALTLDDSGRLGLRLVRQDPGQGAVAAFAPVTFLRDTPGGAWLAGLPEEADVIVVGQEYVTEGVPLDVTYREEISQ